MSESVAVPQVKICTGEEARTMTDTKDFGSTDPKSPKVTFSSIPAFEDESTTDAPEGNSDAAFPARNSLRPRPRSMSHHLSRADVPSRGWLKTKAKFWRSLMTLAMHFHDYAPPRAPRPNRTIEIPTNTTPIQLFVYLPPRYHETLRRDPQFRFPAVINFHGGGFCLGDARDDRYWARVVLEYTNCIFISVNYRRAPEHPFPAPLDDCVDAILYVSEHAADLHVDQTNLALSGFSAGANLAFAAPLRLKYHRKVNSVEPGHSSRPGTPQSEDNDKAASPAAFDRQPFVTPTHSTANLVQPGADAPLQIRTVVAWYPLLDWTTSRSRKIRESRNPKKCLPKAFTDLFDFSYLPPPDLLGDHCSPYASPGLARDHMIRDGLPRDIQMWLCEWDMLLREGQVFADRLEKLDKNIDSKMIPRVPHAWDKSPNPFRDQQAIDMLYTKSAINLNNVFLNKDGMGPANSMSSLHPTDTIIQRQPRRSIVLPL